MALLKEDRAHMPDIKEILGIITAAAISFAATNIDDIVVFAVFYAQAADGRSKARIRYGRYIGTGLLLIISAFGIRLVALLPKTVTGLLGLIPVYMGIKSYFEFRRPACGQTAAPADQLLSVKAAAVLTIANGADNIGVYVPLFSSYSTTGIILTGAVFMALTEVFCWVSDKLGNQPAIKKQIEKYQAVLVPVVLVGLGIVIIIKSLV